MLPVKLWSAVFSANTAMFASQYQVATEQAELAFKREARVPGFDFLVEVAWARFDHAPLMKAYVVPGVSSKPNGLNALVDVDHRVVEHVPLPASGPRKSGNGAAWLADWRSA